MNALDQSRAPRAAAVTQPVRLLIKAKPPCLPVASAMRKAEPRAV